MKKLLLFVAAGLVLCCAGRSASAQGSTEYGAGIKLPLNEDGSKYIRFITWHQVWVRYNEHNSGTIRNGEPVDNTLDFGLRRSRFLTYSQISPRFLVLLHFGVNNQNTLSGGANPALDGKKPQIFIHDAWTEYKVFDTELSIGAGLHYWNGVSRMTNASTLNLMTIDAPIFNWATIDAADQFGRMLGVYAKGKLAKLDYRVAVNDPFLTNTAEAIGQNANYNPRNNNKVYQGYFNWQFWNQESNLLPFMVGTYLGTRRVFNIGAGFMHNKDGMWREENTVAGIQTVKENISLFGVDAFLDLPLNTEANTALTAYGAYYNYNFGRNNVRNIGIMNPAQGGGGLRGNAFPTIGTGDILYGQVGYLLPEDLITEKARLQPYAAYSYGNLDGVQNSGGEKVTVKMLDLGANLLLEGHHSKLTLNYRNRPDFTNPDNQKYRPEITLQAMIYL
ncbi:hypothetical protein K3G39_15305 [Pontibacter sp. HSC-14F20]|uniref:hypothetical protein n=1 Tax=Pontibacter sp. HSC-14F20 TaxID=2864136 RepID=UPI001C7312D7|nr:hypothetical protein [Pontibacter sp. HSC-14F20]MBX0334607.1 hypothetical protein [Pontibacter sp. HSC-14F20]